MSIFDKMFKKNAFDKKMDETYENFVNNNPAMKAVRGIIDEAEDGITNGLEEELYGKTGVRPVPKEDKEAMMREWDSMIDQIMEKELRSYKICPSCFEAAPADLDYCPECGAKLPETTAESRICPYCGGKNRIWDFECAYCGKELELTPEDDE